VVWAMLSRWLRGLLQLNSGAAEAMGSESAPMDVVGRANVQVGRAEGNVTVIHNHVTQHVTHGRMSSPRKGRKATKEQRHVLRLLREVQREDGVLDFMQREFGTRRVIDLAPPELYRVQRYIEVVKESSVATPVASVEAGGKYS
jgi:hypothetical protein